MSRELAVLDKYGGSSELLGSLLNSVCWWEFPNYVVSGENKHLWFQNLSLSVLVSIGFSFSPVLCLSVSPCHLLFVSLSLFVCSCPVLFLSICTSVLFSNSTSLFLSSSLCLFVPVSLSLCFFKSLGLFLSCSLLPLGLFFSLSLSLFLCFFVILFRLGLLHQENTLSSWSLE